MNENVDPSPIVLLQVLGNSDAGVTDLEADHHAVHHGLHERDPHRHLAVRGELDGVAQEIGEDLPQAQRVSVHGARNGFVQRAQELQALPVAPFREQRNGLLHEGSEIELRGLEVELARLDLRDVEDVVDDAQEQLARLTRHRGVVPLPRVELGEQEQLGHAEHAVHRRAQLVAHAGEELALRAAGTLCKLPRALELDGVRLLLLLVGLEAPAHLVDAPAQLAHGVLERSVDPVREVALPERLGGAQDRREVTLEGRAEQEAQEDAADGGDDGADRQHDRGVLRRFQDPEVGRLDHLGGPVGIEGGPIDRVVDEHLDVLDGLGRGLLRRVVDPGLEKDVEGGPEPSLLHLQLRHALDLGGRQLERLELREDAADVVELLDEATELLAHVVALLRPVEVSADHGEPQGHLGELPLLHFLQVHLGVNLLHHAAQARHREERTHDHDGQERPDAQPARRAERDVHLPFLGATLRKSRSNASPVR